MQPKFIVYPCLLDLDTKANKKLIFLEKCPPSFTPNRRRGFAGAYPPTGEQIIIQFYGYHGYLQEANKMVDPTKTQSSARDAAKLVVEDVQAWYETTGIAIKSCHSVQEMVLKMLGEFKLRLKHKSIGTEAELKKQKEFLEQIGYTFYVVQPRHEKQLQELQATGKQDHRVREDRLYLECQPGETRIATLGHLDKYKLPIKDKHAISDLNANEYSTGWNSTTTVQVDGNLQIIYAIKVSECSDLKQCYSDGCCKWWITSCAISTLVGLILSLTFVSPIGIIGAPWGPGEIICAILGIVCCVIPTTLLILGNHWRKPMLLLVYLWISIYLTYTALLWWYCRPNDFCLMYILYMGSITMFSVLYRYVSISQSHSQNLYLANNISESPINHKVMVPLMVLLFIILILLVVFSFELMPVQNTRYLCNITSNNSMAVPSVPLG